MFFIKIKYTLYGTIISASLITLVAQASSVDGVFGDYFRKMVGTCTLGTDQVITGFDNNPNYFGEKVCTTLTSLLDTIGIKVSSGNVGIGTVTAPTTRLEVAGMVKSSPTTLSDSSDTLTTRSYVDAGLINLCNKVGTWNYVFNTCDIAATETDEIANCVPASTALMDTKGLPKTLCYNDPGQFACYYSAWRMNTNVGGYVSAHATYYETMNLPNMYHPYFSKVTIYCADNNHLSTNPKNHGCYQDTSYGPGGPVRDFQVLNLSNYCMIY